MDNALITHATPGRDTALFSFVGFKSDLCSTCVIVQLHAISCYTGPRYIKNSLYLNVIDQSVHNFLATKLLSGHHIWWWQICLWMLKMGVFISLWIWSPSDTYGIFLTALKLILKDRYFKDRAHLSTFKIFIFEKFSCFIVLVVFLVIVQSSELVSVWFCEKITFFPNFFSYHIFAIHVGGASLGLPTACRLIVPFHKSQCALRYLDPMSKIQNTSSQRSLVTWLTVTANEQNDDWTAPVCVVSVQPVIGWRKDGSGSALVTHSTQATPPWQFATAMCREKRCLILSQIFFIKITLRATKPPR